MMLVLYRFYKGDMDSFFFIRENGSKYSTPEIVRTLD